jgi:hypothetical protein
MPEVAEAVPAQTPLVVLALPHPQRVRHAEYLL